MMPRGARPRSWRKITSAPDHAAREAQILHFSERRARRGRRTSFRNMPTGRIPGPPFRGGTTSVPKPRATGSDQRRPRRSAFLRRAGDRSRASRYPVGWLKPAPATTETDIPRWGASVARFPVPPPAHSMMVPRSPCSAACVSPRIPPAVSTMRSISPRIAVAGIGERPGEALVEFVLAGFQLAKPVGPAPHVAALLDGRDHGPDLLSRCP